MTKDRKRRRVTGLKISQEMRYWAMKMILFEKSAGPEDGGLYYKVHLARKLIEEWFI
jgi:hypothetical protein